MYEVSKSPNDLAILITSVHSPHNRRLKRQLDSIETDRSDPVGRGSRLMSLHNCYTINVMNIFTKACAIFADFWRILIGRGGNKIGGKLQLKTARSRQSSLLPIPFANHATFVNILQSSSNLEVDNRKHLSSKWSKIHTCVLL